MISEVNINRIPDYIRIHTGSEIILADKCDDSFKSRDIKIDFSVDERLKVFLTAESTPVKYIALRWNGRTEKNVKFLGDAVERGYGHLEWRSAVPNRVMPWYFIASDEKDSMGFGVMVRANSFAYWNADSQGVTLWLDTRCGGDGVILDGKKLECATVVSDKSNGENPFNFTKNFCKKMCLDPILPKEPVYGSNNWYYAYGNSSAEQILRDTDLIVELTEGLKNRPYMVIDDCWQPNSATVDAAGRPMANGNEKFPDMKKLADDMRSKGVKPGIWIRPLYTLDDNDPENIRCDRDRDYLDITEPESLKLIAEDINRVTKDWGYELVKFDFATYDVMGLFPRTDFAFISEVKSGWRLHNTSTTNAEAIVNFYKVLKENSNDAVLIGCNVVGHLAAGLIHVHRSGDDTSGREWKRTEFMGVNTLAFRLPQNKAFFNIDADCVGVTAKVPWKMNRRFLELVSKSGSPLFCSINPDIVTEEMKADLREAYRINSVQKNEMEVLDWFGTTSPEEYSVDGEIIKFNWVEEEGFDDFII